MTTPKVQPWVDGVPLATVGAWSDVEIKHNRNGAYEATWTMALRDNQRPRCLRSKAQVEVHAGTRRVFAGTLGQPDWDSLEFAAIGIARQGEGAECFTASRSLTSKPNTAIDQAIARGVTNWVRVSDFGNTDIAGPEGDSSHDDPEPGKLSDLLNLWAEENNSQWRVLNDRRLMIAADDTAPRWFIVPNAGVLGVADDDVTDAVSLRYFDSTANLRRTAVYPATTPPQGIERKASVIDSGPMSASRAMSIATGIYTKALGGKVGWSNGLELFEGQILTAGGRLANLALIRPGQVVRMLDTIDPRNGRHSLDFVIDETIWRPGERSIQLNPVGLAARTWEQILTDYRAKAA